MYGFKEKTPRLECLNIESKSTISSSDVKDFKKATKHMPVGICFFKAPDECTDGIALYLPKKDQILEYPLPPWAAIRLSSDRALSRTLRFVQGSGY